MADKSVQCPNGRQLQFSVQIEGDLESVKNDRQQPESEDVDYSTQSFDEADLEEATPRKTDRTEIEEACDVDGASR